MGGVVSERACGGRGVKRTLHRAGPKPRRVIWCGRRQTRVKVQASALSATPADAHHMGSCGPRAFVGGWAPAGTGLCCNHSGPWRPAAAVGEPAAWRSSSCLPSDWTSPLQGESSTTGTKVSGNLIKSRTLWGFFVLPRDCCTVCYYLKALKCEDWPDTPKEPCLIT